MKENKLLQRGRYFNSNYFFEEFSTDWNKYDFVKLFPYANGMYGLKADGSLWICGLNGFGVGKAYDILTSYNNAMLYSIKEFTKIDVGITDIKKVVSNTYSTLILTNSGELYGAGINYNAELGMGDRNVRNTFIKIPVTDVKDVECFSEKICVILKNDGTVWGAGNPEIGNGDTRGNLFGFGDNYSMKLSYTKLPIENVKYIKIVCYNLFVIKNDDTVWTTGNNTYSQLGLGHNTNVTTFTKIGIDNVKEICGGINHTIILKNDNTVWGTGYNTNGELGTGDTTNKLSFTSIATNVKQVVAGNTNTVIFKLDGTVWGTGNKSYIGINSNSGISNAFIKIEDLYNIKYILSNNAYTFYAITNDNKIYFTGNNNIYNIGCKDFVNDTRFITYCTYKNRDYIGYNKSINVGRDTYLLKENGDYLIYNKGDKIYCGDTHTFLLKGNGILYGTGYNSSGQLGLGHNTNVTTFTKIKDNVKDVACGNGYTIILKNDNTVWGTGYNTNGELGLGHNTKTNVFEKINIDNVKDVACGSNYTIILKNNGTVWGTGYNSSGQLGLGHNTNVTTFTKIGIDNVKDVACGNNHTIILKNDDTVWGTGNNTNGQLGLGHNNVVKEFTKVDISDVKQIDAGGYSTYILKNNSELWVTGNNANGQLGLGNLTSPINTFTLARSYVQYICKSSPGSSHKLILDCTGVILATGNNNKNQIYNSGSNINSFTTILPDNMRIRHAVSGAEYTIMITDGNKVYIRGSNMIGQLGMGDGTASFNSTSEASWSWMINNNVTNFINNSKVVCSEVNRTFILKNDGDVYSTGVNTNGELGTGNTTDLKTFTKVNINNVKDISIGTDATIILKTDGTVWGTGITANGALGNISGSRNTFTKLEDIGHNIVQVSAGSRYTLLLTDTGNVYGSGGNASGELGMTSPNSFRTFTKLPINDVKYIKANKSSSFVIKNDNTLWATGYNNNGELGLGHNNVVKEFTKVDISDVKEVICGVEFTAILKTDNTLWVTGKNHVGQLCLGDNTNRNLFTKVDNVDNIKKVQCGYGCIVVLKNDNTVWAQGYNANGELGTGNTTDLKTFTKIKDNVKDISCGAHCTILTLNDGTVWGAGNNTYGQLGLVELTTTASLRKLMNYNLFDFNKINSITTNTNFNLVNNQYLIPVKDTYYIYNTESDYELNYNKLLGSNSIPTHPEAYNVIKIPVENIKEFWMSKTHSLIVNTNGELYGCGSNLYRQLLNPPTTTELSSFTKLNFDNIKQASAGTGFSYFVKNDGTLYSVGLNGSYQLGLGHNNEVTEPQRVPGISNAKKVMCDHNFTLVLLNDNTLWVQGHNRNGNLGLGASKVNQTIINFTKVADNVDDVEIGYDYILFRKTDNTVYISGKIRDHYKIAGNDTTIFNKIEIPDFVNPEDLTWVNPLNEETTVMIYKTHTMNSTIEIMEKTISGFKVKIDDIGNPIIKIEMYINNELITTMTQFTNKIAAFSIPLDKIILGTNNVVFKGYDDYNNNMYASAIINKENNAICVTEDSNLLINRKRYTVKSITDTENKITVTLDRELEGNINVGDIIYQLINKLKVQIKTNNTGMHKDAKLLEIKKVDTGYQEIYEFKENGIKEVEPKIIVNGNEDTAIKRPSMIFSIDEETL
ncbi:TPA: RCC1 domain-containing protein [Clostridioides difficile]